MDRLIRQTLEETPALGPATLRYWLDERLAAIADEAEFTRLLQGALAVQAFDELF